MLSSWRNNKVLNFFIITLTLFVFGIGSALVLFHHHPGYANGYDPDCHLCVTRNFIFHETPFLLSCLSYLTVLGVMLGYGITSFGLHHCHTHSENTKHHHGPCLICLWKTFLLETLRGDLSIIMAGIVPIILEFYPLVQVPFVQTLKVAPQQVRAPPVFSF